MEQKAICWEEGRLKIVEYEYYFILQVGFPCLRKYKIKVLFVVQVLSDFDFSFMFRLIL